MRSIPQRLLSDQTCCKCGALVDEAKLVSERVGAVETSLAPRLGLDWAHDVAFDLPRDAPKVLFQIVDREVEMVGVWRCVPGIAIGARIETGKDDRATAKIVAPGRNPASRLIQDGTVESGGFVNPGHGNDHTKQARWGHVRQYAACRSRRKRALSSTLFQMEGVHEEVCGELRRA